MECSRAGHPDDPVLLPIPCIMQARMEAPTLYAASTTTLSFAVTSLCSLTCAVPHPTAWAMTCDRTSS